jgi:D-sedoheptulose 7-phosphate isomerase
MVNDRQAGRAELFHQLFEHSIRTHQRVQGLGAASVIAAADAIQRAWHGSGKLLVFGNGGSAADAQHLAADLVGRFTRERQALAAVALSTDTSVLTSLANDYSYDRVFSRQVEALGRAGDVAFGITTSGRSPNIAAALARARELELTTIALTGRDGGTAAAYADVHINVPDASTARVQEVHRTLLHVLCEMLERELETAAID